MADDVTKSWFCVFNNPSEHGYEGEPKEVLERLKNEWIDNKPTRSGAWAYCVSADGLHHVHMVLEDTRAMRFTAIKNSYAAGMHFEPTKGNKEQAESYIKKLGKYEEKGEQVLCFEQHGEIKGAQGSRKDLDIIESLIEQGKTPREVMNMSLSYRRYEKLIKDAYFEKRSKETLFLRDVNVTWHVGESGSGKSYVACELRDMFGDDDFYFVSDYDTGGMDRYNGERLLFLDEFRGQIRYSTLLSMLQGYKTQTHARYTNIIGLWTEVHITSVLPPEKVYSNMVSEHKDLDTLKQLLRRIDHMVYHYKDENGKYRTYYLPMSEYKDYKDLIYRALGKYDSFEQENIPFD